MKKPKKKNILLSLIFLSLLIIIIYWLVPYYRIEDRVKEQKNFRGINQERAIGWIRVQGTNIDFPIVSYDESDVSDPTNDLGWSFSNNGKLSKKITVYSHNILNVSSTPLITDANHHRFEQLLSYIYTDFVKKNKYIQYTVDGKNYLYKIYGVSIQKGQELNDEENPSKENLKKYIQKTKKSSYFDFGLDVNSNDKLITLVTCTRFFGETTEYSFVVDARMMRKNEKNKNYNVKETKQYKDIKKKLEGDVDDETI